MSQNINLRWILPILEEQQHKVPSVFILSLLFKGLDHCLGGQLFNHLDSTEQIMNKVLYEAGRLKTLIQKVRALRRRYDVSRNPTLQKMKDCFECLFKVHKQKIENHTTKNEGLNHPAVQEKVGCSRYR